MTGQFARIESQPSPAYKNQFTSKWRGHYLCENPPPAPPRRKTDLELVDDAIVELHEKYRGSLMRPAGCG